MGNHFAQLTRTLQLVTDDLRIKIADFGLSKLASATQGTAVAKGTPGYMAPELSTKKRNGPPVDPFAADIFSCAIIFWELFTNQIFYRDYAADFENAFQLIGEFVQGGRPPFPSTTDPKAKALIESMWKGDPKARPDLEAVADQLKQIKVA